MSGNFYKKITVYLVGTVFLFQLSYLCWEHFNGGVVSHHILHRPDLPSISNWWGAIILPVLAWFFSVRIKRKIISQSGEVPTKIRIPAEILIGFFGMLIITILQSASWKLGFQNITMYLALGALITGLFLPIYCSECILGYVLGATVVFGAVLPLIGILVMALISAFSNLLVKPLVLRAVGGKAL